MIYSNELEFDPYEENLQTGYWIDSSGGEIHVDDMSIKHLRNAKNKCLHAARIANFSCDKEKWEGWVYLFNIAISNKSTSNQTTKNQEPSKTFPAQKKKTRGAKIDVCCKRCGDIFIARVADRKRGWAKFCSKSCKAFAQSSKKYRN